ncbi:MAG TPA: MASE1 domain-containing protein [Oculatellaceae cyanobacterium]|jgi:signal transduction histidine kinase/class 3 adenylate cyclase
MSAVKSLLQPSAPPIHIRLLQQTIVAIAYYITAEFSFSLASLPGNVTAVWPASGIALAGILIWGYPIGIGILIGSFAIELKTNGFNRTGLALTLITALGPVLAALIGAYWVKATQNPYPLHRVKHTVYLLALGGLLSTLVDALMGCVGLCLAGEAPWSSFGIIFYSWWMGDAMGVFIITPLVLTWHSGWRNLRQLLAKRGLEAATLVFLAIAVSRITFGGGYPVVYMLIPLLVWAAFRCGQLLTTLMVVIISAISVIETVRGLGPFVRVSQNESLLLLESFLGVVALTTLLLSAVISENEQANTKLKTANIELQRLDRLKDEFLANTSHELRTPLNGIIGISESLIDGATGNLSELTRSNLSLIVASGRRLANLVNDILDFSKMKHGLELQLQPVNISAIANLVLALSQTIVGKKELQLINAIPENFPLALADENRLQQIFYNLVGNAIKFSDRGIVEISAKIVPNPLTSELEQIAISVRDTGIGIPEDKFERIFESFEQVDGSTSRQYAGTGLGLAVTKQLVGLHRGKITVSSTIGIGSCFTFTLPIASTQVEEATNQFSVTTTTEQLSKVHQERTFEAEQSPTLALLHKENNLIALLEKLAASKEEQNLKFTILVVDDEPVNRQILFNHLTIEKYAIIEAENGIQAIDIIQSGLIPDIILLDIMMPHMSGYEVCQKLRETLPPDLLPIMFLTAKNQMSDVVTGFQIGGNDYVTKPFQKEELIARIKNHINLKQLKTEKDFIRSTFGRYLTEEVVNELLSHPDALKLGGERRKITILTSDLRGFTSTAERLQPEKVVKILNFYLEQMADVITKYRGTIDEFMGDGILVLFGAPIPREDDTTRAVACAVEMQLQLKSVNEQMKTWGLPPLEMGIGINTGEVVVGNIGSERRTKYGVVGNQVNLTYRIESYTTDGEILISASTLKEAGTIVQVAGEKQVKPKGIQQLITIYSVSGIAGDYNLFLMPEEEVFKSLVVPLPLQYSVLDGKHLSDNLFTGSLIKLSHKGGQIVVKQTDTDFIPSAFTNIKLNFLNLIAGEVTEGIYAKVLEISADDSSFYICFTAKPPHLAEKLNELYSCLP